MSRLSKIAEANPWRQNPGSNPWPRPRDAPRSSPRAYMALVGGSEAGVTPRDNMDAFSELEPKPHVIGAKQTGTWRPPSWAADQPAGDDDLADRVQAVTPDGEVDVARAAAARAPRWV